ncbi:MAG: MCE family protein [Prevotella sp.]|nr:MCE family protein [Candidatus Equicola stercoris]
MKTFFSHEVKIAIIAIIAIVILFFGLQFLKGLNIFSSSRIYYAKFENIKGLAAGSPILASGYQIGTVKDIAYDYDNNGEIVVELRIDKHLQIPVGSHAELATEMLGGTKLNLSLTDNTQFYSAGDTLMGNSSLGALEKATEMIPSIEKMLPKLDSILMNVNALLSDPSTSGTIHNIEYITSQLKTSTEELNGILGEVNNSLPGMMQKADATMTHLSSVTKKIDDANIDKTLARVDHAVKDVRDITSKINKGYGTIGALVNDKSLYDNLNHSVVALDSTLKSTEALVKDLKEHPKDYVHFSLFGRKDKRKK